MHPCLIFLDPKHCLLDRFDHLHKCCERKIKHSALLDVTPIDFYNLGLRCTCFKSKWERLRVPSHFKETIKQKRSSHFTRNNLCIGWRKKKISSGNAPGCSRYWLGKARGQGPLKLNKSKFILLTDVDYIKAIGTPPAPQFFFKQLILLYNLHNKDKVRF